MKSPKPAKNKRQTNHQSGRPGIHYPKNTRTHPDRVKEQAREKLVKFSRATRNSWHSPQKSTQKIVHRHTIEFSKNTGTPSTTGHSRPLQAAREELSTSDFNRANGFDRIVSGLPPAPASVSPCGVGLADSQNITHAVENNAKRHVNPRKARPVSRASGSHPPIIGPYCAPVPRYLRPARPHPTTFPPPRPKHRARHRR